MELWQVKGKPVAADLIDLKPVRVLYEFDGPRIFTCADKRGNEYLAYQCGEWQNRLRYLVVPFTGSLELELRSGQIDLREALSRPEAWVLDLDYQWRPLEAWKTDVDWLPRLVLPRHGVMLYRHLKPAPVRRWRAAAASGQLVISFPARWKCETYSVAEHPAVSASAANA